MWGVGTLKNSSSVAANASPGRRGSAGSQRHHDEADAHERRDQRHRGGSGGDDKERSEPAARDEQWKMSAPAPPSLQPELPEHIGTTPVRDRAAEAALLARRLLQTPTSSAMSGDYGGAPLFVLGGSTSGGGAESRSEPPPSARRQQAEDELRMLQERQRIKRAEQQLRQQRFEEMKRAIEERELAQKHTESAALMDLNNRSAVSSAASAASGPFALANARAAMAAAVAAAAPPPPPPPVLDAQLDARRAKLKAFVGKVVIAHLKASYRSRLPDKDDFKSISRKLTHQVLEKEAKRGYKVADESKTKRKVREFVDAFFDRHPGIVSRKSLR